MFSWLNNREQNNDGAAAAGDITNGRFYWVTGRQRLVEQVLAASSDNIISFCA